MSCEVTDIGRRCAAALLMWMMKLAAAQNDLCEDGETANICFHLAFNNFPRKLRL